MLIFYVTGTWVATEQTRRDEINFPRSVMAVLAPLMAVVLVATSDQTIVAAGPAPSTGLLIAFRALPASAAAG
jgi:hypothetical protein